MTSATFVHPSQHRIISCGKRRVCLCTRLPFTKIKEGKEIRGPTTGLEGWQPEEPALGAPSTFQSRARNGRGSRPSPLQKSIFCNLGFCPNHVAKFLTRIGHACLFEPLHRKVPETVLIRPELSPPKEHPLNSQAMMRGKLRDGARPQCECLPQFI